MTLPDFFHGMLGGALVCLAVYLVREAIVRRARSRHSGSVRFAPDGSCWFGHELDETPSTAAENNRQ